MGTDVPFSGTHGTGAPTTHTYDTATDLVSPTKTGYTFNGWFTDSACSGTAVTSLGATDYTSNITLYAKWTVNSYTITYKDMGTDVAFSGTHGTGAPSTHTYDTTTALVSPTKTGYTFNGWFTDSVCSGTPVASLGTTDYTSNITLYAKWTYIPIFTPNVTRYARRTVISATAPTVDSVNGATLEYGYKNGAVSVKTTPADGHTITDYQWYSNATYSNDGGKPVSGATSARYNIPAGKDVGSYYYYCIVTSERTDNNQTASVTSGVAVLEVQKAKVERPTANTTAFIYSGQGQTYTPTAFDSKLMDISNNVQTEAGSYEVSVSLKDTANYEWATSGDATVPLTFTIEAAEVDEVPKKSNSAWLWITLSLASVAGLSFFFFYIKRRKDR